MFCNQCQETAGGKGCTVKGVCGKSAVVADKQDDLIFATEVLSLVTTKLRAESENIPIEINHMITTNLFMTITNANFDPTAIDRVIDKTKRAAEELYGKSDVQLPADTRVQRGEPNEVLLALLFLGVKNIHLGPTLPAFLSPNVAKLLVEQFGIGTISSVEDDINTMI